MLFLLPHTRTMFTHPGPIFCSPKCSCRKQGQDVSNVNFLPLWWILNVGGEQQAFVCCRDQDHFLHLWKLWPCQNFLISPKEIEVPETLSAYLSVQPVICLSLYSFNKSISLCTSGPLSTSSFPFQNFGRWTFNK